MRVLKLVIFAACLVPAGLLAWRGAHNNLTANPIEFITHWTGDWTLRLLLITLAITPLRLLTGWHAIIRVRRMLGLFVYFYAALHFLTFVVLDNFFAFDLMLSRVREEPFIMAGLTSFVLLTPLAITSSHAMMRRLGGGRWQALHRLVYLSAIAGAVHYMWLTKIDIRPPLMYLTGVAVLLGFRLWRSMRRRSTQLFRGAPRVTAAPDNHVVNDL
jgi:sulfoxide reductase heme-binding subunit YedZ